MTADVAMPGDFSGCMPSSVSRSERTPARAGAPTPFYDQLISMIEATAQENRRVVESTELHGDAADAGHWWRIHPLIPCIAAHLAKNLGVFVIKLAQGHVSGWW